MREKSTLIKILSVWDISKSATSVCYLLHLNLIKTTQNHLFFKKSIFHF